MDIAAEPERGGDGNRPGGEESEQKYPFGGHRQHAADVEVAQADCEEGKPRSGREPPRLRVLPLPGTLEDGDERDLMDDEEACRPGEDERVGPGVDDRRGGKPGGEGGFLACPETASIPVIRRTGRMIDKITFTFVLFCFVSIFLFPFKKLSLFHNNTRFSVQTSASRGC